jgi:DNA-binding LytR/AlgR family response regulator
MHVRFEQDDQLDEPEVVIRAAAPSAETQHLQQLLAAHTITAYRDSQEFFLDPADIIFVQTEEHTVQVHTADQIYQSKERLYALEDSLPGYFARVAKSTIINLYQVSAVNRSLANCWISFRRSHKQVYASRRYYRQLQDRLNETRSSHE